MLSVADIPFAGTHFTGSVGSVFFRGKEYRLATYKGLKIQNSPHASFWSARAA